MSGLLLAVVMVNECKGLTPADYWYWLLSCWALPSALMPVLAGGMAMGAGYAVTVIGRRYRVFRFCGHSRLQALANALKLNRQK